jgi:23S rRNA (cytidine1920-2'-O)/16S rRNA (cytidine1409-2'-O)-methyltransferase
MKKVRLDQLLVDRSLAQSRERAKACIMAGDVFVDGRRVDKPGTAVDPDSPLELRAAQFPYVSRGGLKLEKALRVFPVDPAGRICLDCGASTGGFTDVLLQNGAARVYAADVGYGQLAWKLRTDPRVVNLERTNVRYLTREQVPEEIGLGVCDVSFISIRLILPAVHALLREGADMICLIKPQFEAGREKVGKKGVVRERAVHLEVLESLIAFFPGAGFTLMGLDDSPIRGPEGNIEFLAWLKRGAFEAAAPDAAAVVDAAHARWKEKQP